MHPQPTPKPSALSVLNLKCLAISLEGHLYAPSYPTGAGLVGGRGVDGALSTTAAG